VNFAKFGSLKIMPYCCAMRSTKRQMQLTTHSVVLPRDTSASARSADVSDMVLVAQLLTLLIGLVPFENLVGNTKVHKTGEHLAGRILNW
jgi:hypothetical protein